MRRGFDRLALQVQEMLKHDPHSGHLFVFCGRRGGLIKVLLTARACAYLPSVWNGVALSGHLQLMGC